MKYRLPLVGICCLSLMAPTAWAATTQPASQPATTAVAKILPHKSPLKDKEMIPLYTDKVPYAQGDKPEDTPAIEVHLPKPENNPNQTALIVLPGGGYAGLVGHEWAPPADWANEHGMTAFVLRYRVGPKYHHPAELSDGLRAVRYIRAHAKEWNIDPKKIGLIGFSAGGHLGSAVSTHFDNGNSKSTDPVEQASSRPDFQILIYPVISMGSAGHSFSREMLMGPNQDPKLVDFLSSEKQVKKNTPPAFIAHSTQDRVVPIQNSDMYVEALKKQGIPVMYMKGAYGDHGFADFETPGLAMKKFWMVPCVEWLTKQHFLPTPPITK